MVEVNLPDLSGWLKEDNGSAYLGLFLFNTEDPHDFTELKLSLNAKGDRQVITDLIVDDQNALSFAQTTTARHAVLRLRWG